LPFLVKSSLIRNYKYYLSSFGKRVVAAGLHLKTFLLAPQLCATAPG
jgi:hypothetical protein